MQKQPICVTLKSKGEIRFEIKFGGQEMVVMID